MARHLPPLNGLRAFEAAARHLSFAKAAEELNVTPAAVSQQVKALEAFYGVTLFRRMTRALVLTDIGQAALPALRDGFDKLAEGASRMSTNQPNSVLTVSVTPSFGGKWLVPRLERFASAHPEFDVRIDATEDLAKFGADDVDVAIRYGIGIYDDLHSVCLMADAAFPVCSPSLLTGPKPLCTPDDLRHHTLLHVHWKTQSELQPNWRMWLKAAGIDDIDISRGPRFSYEGLSVQAAIEGMGVALALQSLVIDDLRAGRLVRPFPPAITDATHFCYYFVCPHANAELDKVKAFRDWVIREAVNAEPV